MGGGGELLWKKWHLAEAQTDYWFQMNLERKKIPVRWRAGDKLQGRTMLSLSPSSTLASERKAGKSLFFPHRKKSTLGGWSTLDSAMPSGRDGSPATLHLCFTGGQSSLGQAHEPFCGPELFKDGAVSNIQELRCWNDVWLCWGFCRRHLN